MYPYCILICVSLYVCLICILMASSYVCPYMYALYACLTCILMAFSYVCPYIYLDIRDLTGSDRRLYMCPLYVCRLHLYMCPSLIYVSLTGSDRRLYMCPLYVCRLHLYMCPSLTYVSLTGSDRRLMGKWCDQRLVPRAEFLKTSAPHTTYLRDK